MAFCRRLALCVSLAAVLTSAAALAATAQAPGVGVNLVALDARHRLLGDLLGPALHLDFPINDGGMTVRFYAERLTGTGQRTGTTCVGFILPSNPCPTESLRDEARLTSVAGGLAIPLLRQQLAMTLVGDLRLAHVRSATRGQTSGRTLGATKMLKGADIGVEALWAPWTAKPLALEVGLLAGGLAPVIQDAGADGYWPFQNGFQVRAFRVGLVWQPAR
jgi:hypothetical protein